MLKMYLEDVRWNSESELSVLVFSNLECSETMELYVPSAVGFDLWVTLDVKREDGDMPYFGIMDIISQIDGEFIMLFVGKNQAPETIMAKLEITGVQFEVEMTVKDAVTIAILQDLPIYFDKSLRNKDKLSLSQKLFRKKISEITRYSF
jgi:bifunctional DNase/RNase